MEDVGRTALEALVAADSDALERLRLTEHEHNEVVWPELPAAAPEVGFPVDLAWSNIRARNHSALVRIVPQYRGRPTRFERTECRGETQVFDTFEVLTDCWVVFTREDSPGLLEAQLFKDVVQRGGGLKIFRYYDEEPQPHR